MITVLGIDPGLAETGVGIVRGSGRCIHNYSYGSIQTSKKQSLPHRLERIYCTVMELLKENPSDLMVVEDVFSLEKYPKSGIQLGKVAGVILLAGRQCGVPVFEVPVREAKQVLTGNGNAGKKQLERAVRELLNSQEPIRPDHASDALGLATIGLFRFGDQWK